MKNRNSQPVTHCPAAVPPGHLPSRRLSFHPRRRIVLADRPVYTVSCLAILTTNCLLSVATIQATETTPGRQAAAVEPVDIAKFARVVASDPKRAKGTKATRLEEMPAKDVFLETGVKPASDGTYAIPVTAAGFGCIGLRWNEPRLLRHLELHWSDKTPPPSPDSTRLQYWVGQSPWQGEWKTLSARFEQSDRHWSWSIVKKNQPERTIRVRWIFSELEGTPALKTISALGQLTWLTTKLRAELAGRPSVGEGQVTVYNGELLEDGAKEVSRRGAWCLSEPLWLKVRYSKPAPLKAERTVLRFKLPSRAVSVAVEDVVSHGCVYVPSAGLFVISDQSQMTPAKYLQQIADKNTVLEEVRRRPDRSLAEAMSAVHNPIQNSGPTLLSLACDNRKFIVERDGTVRFRVVLDAPDADYPSLISYRKYKPHYTPYPQLTPRFGSGRSPSHRHLDGGWLPKPTVTVTEKGIKYQQRTYVAPIDTESPEGSPDWYRKRAVCVSEYAIENTLSEAADVSLRVRLEQSRHKRLSIYKFQKIDDSIVVSNGARVIVMFDTGEATPLQVTRKGEDVFLKGKLPGGKQARLVAYIPAWPVKPAKFAVLKNTDRWAAQTEKYWTDILGGAMQVDLPDPFLCNVIRASQVHCMIAARNEEKGRYVAPWVSAMLYDALDSEAQAVIRGMDMCGFEDFSRRGLEFFLKRYNKRGYFTTGYTIIGAGQHLWNIAEHYSRYPDRVWLNKQTPTLLGACKRIVAQRAKTRKLDSHGKKVPEYGLMPAGATADYGGFFYRFFNDAQFYYGLQTMARLLADSGHPDAPALLADAKNYRQDIMRSYRWTEERSPVVPLRNGAWAPNPPAHLYLFGNIEDMLVVRVPNKTMIYNAEIGANHLVTNGIFEPDSREAAEIMDYLEDHQFLRSGHKDYKEEKNRKDVFALGGFGKVQPYYGRNAEVCALRDDVKPFIRSYFNAMSSLICEENLTFWEHFGSTGAWNKPHETGWFLAQTAMMFSMDRDGELWLAPMVTNRWMEDGMTVSVRNAPTRFGKVSYSITSSVAAGHVDAEIEPPMRETPKHLVIRIRHPEEKPIRAVTVNGRPHSDFDVRRECVRIAPTKRPVRVRVEY
jgi:hypothetical protein